MSKFNINDWIKGKVEPNSLIYNRLDIGTDVYLKHNYPDGKTILEFEKYVCDAINEKREREEKNVLPYIGRARPFKNVTLLDFGALKITDGRKDIIKPFTKYEVTIKEIK